MDPATTALIGVIAGALLTGGLSLAQTQLELRLASRTAARLLSLALNDVDTDLTIIHDKQRLPVRLEAFDSYDWTRALALWDARQEDLARVISNYEFKVLGLTFEMVRVGWNLVMSNAGAALDEDAGRAASLRTLRKRVEESLELLEPHCMTGVERWRHEEDQRRVPPTPPHRADGQIGD